MKLESWGIRAELLAHVTAFNSKSWRVAALEKCEGFTQDWDIAALGINQGIRGLISEGEFGPVVYAEEVYFLKQFLLDDLFLTDEGPPTIPKSHRLGMYLYNDEEFDVILRLAKEFEYVNDLVTGSAESNACCDLCSSKWLNISQLALEAERILRHFDTVAEASD